MLGDHFPVAAAALAAAMRGEVAIAAGVLRIEAPLGVVFPRLEVLDGMVDIFGHEAVAAALEIKNMPPGPVLLDFGFAAVFDNLHLKLGHIFGFAPTEAPEAMGAGGIVVLKKGHGFGRPLLNVG